MKGIVEEYGKIIIMVIITTILFTGIFFGINIWYQSAFPGLSQGNVSAIQTISSGPVLFVDVVEFKKGTNISSATFSSVAKGYSDSTLRTEVEVEVIGIQGIDTSTCGVYQCILAVEDYQGQRFHKVVPVLIY